MKLSTRDMVLAAMFAALSSIGSKIMVPMYPVPMTLQVLFAIGAGLILGKKAGTLSQIIYLALGLMGIPVFAGAEAGPAIVLKPTFGFILGMIVAAYVGGAMREKWKVKKFAPLLGISLIGDLIIYLIGIPYFYMIMNLYLKSQTGILAALQIAMIPFLIPDLVKCVIASLLAYKILPVIGKDPVPAKKEEEMTL